jgi:hypothetical protein
MDNHVDRVVASPATATCSTPSATLGPDHACYQQGNEAVNETNAGQGDSLEKWFVDVCSAAHVIQ